MGALVVVELEVAVQSAIRLLHRLVAMGVNLFVLD
jgi:hypothetical protein